MITKTFSSGISTAFSLLLCITAFAQVPKLSSNQSAQATVYLDFDGHKVEGTAWNWESTIYAKSAPYSPAVITEVFNRVAEDYRIFNINITTDSALFAKAPVTRRIRIIITPTYDWYGEAAGVAYVNSFNWGDGTPAWVFSSFLENNPKYIGEATSHEIGHTLGLQHQSTYDKNCELITEYAEGMGEGRTGWAPIMGIGYYKNTTTWTVGPSILGCDSIQNDVKIICDGEQKIGLIADDHKNNIQNATVLQLAGNAFQLQGTIIDDADKDVFRIVLNHNSVLKVAASPGAPGTDSAAGNIDIKMCLINKNGDTLARINPAESLSATLDTNLRAGTYYISIDGVANNNLDEYGSVGRYLISGSLDAVLPVTKLVAKGQAINKQHTIQWEFEADEPVKETIVELSADGINYSTIATLSPATTVYNYRPSGSGTVYYRIKMIGTIDDRAYYSNVISLKLFAQATLTVNNTIVNTNLQLLSGGNYQYQVFDESGMLYQRGTVNFGTNNIALAGVKKGLLLLRVYNHNETHTFKLMKR